METCSQDHIEITWDDHYGDHPCPLCEVIQERDDIEGKLSNEVNKLEDALEEERKIIIEDLNSLITSLKNK